MARAVHKFLPATPLVVDGQYRGRFAFDGTLLQVIVVPPDESTYDFSIRDEEGLPIFERKGMRGSICVSELDIVLFPGEKNILIQNAVNGLFRIKLIYSQ